ncbi:MAG: DNA replication/repair protein RecF [Lachnospiraceae bacterium]|nr:DNA replication/repair protein RecF [Lachnospiraceae bacterium]
MYIESLELKNYRNYDSLSMTFDKGTNILYGDNAQGKTNVLESIFIAGTTKSHKGSKDRDIIRFDQEESHIRMTVSKHDCEYRIDMHLKKSKPKGVAINGVPIRKARELFGIINIVFFSPEDLNIIKNGPGERRRFIDLELCQLDSLYLSDLTNYNKILNQRNKLLKDIYFDPNLKNTIDVWDEQLVQYGTKIIEKRNKFIYELNEIISDIHSKLTGGLEKLKLFYEPNSGLQEYKEQLVRARETDFKFKTTSIGPHRDDLCVKVNDIDIRKYGSQGQQRTAALSLKLSEIYLVKKVIQDTPILLLDDVLSELDNNRQNYLLNSIKDIQTILTCTGLDELVHNQFEVNKVFQVVAGGIR